MSHHLASCQLLVLADLLMKVSKTVNILAPRYCAGIFGAADVCEHLLVV